MDRNTIGRVVAGDPAARRQLMDWIHNEATEGQLRVALLRIAALAAAEQPPGGALLVAGDPGGYEFCVYEVGRDEDQYHLIAGERDAGAPEDADDMYFAGADLLNIIGGVDA